MAAFVYIPNGQIVKVADGKQLPSALYKPFEEPKKAPKKKAAKKG